MDIQGLTDEQLIALYRQKGEDYYRDCLFRRYERYLRATAISFAKSGKKFFLEEDDIFIEVSLAFYHAMDSFRLESGKFFYYMRVLIARRGCSILKKWAVDRENLEKVIPTYEGVMEKKDTEFDLREPVAAYEEDYGKALDDERAFALFCEFLEKKLNPLEKKITLLCLAMYSHREVAEKQQVTPRKVQCTMRKVKKLWNSPGFQSILKNKEK